MPRTLLVDSSLSAHHVRVEEIVRIHQAEFFLRDRGTSLHLQLQVVAVEVALVMLSVRTLSVENWPGFVQQHQREGTRHTYVYEIGIERQTDIGGEVGTINLSQHI